jgi:hypothetical protein
LTADDLALGYFTYGSQGPEAQTAGRAHGDAAKILETADAHHLVRLEHMVPQATEKVGAPGMKSRSLGSEMLHGLPK